MRVGGILETALSVADVKRAAALDGLAALRNEEAVPHVLERTRYGRLRGVHDGQAPPRGLAYRHLPVPTPD